MPVVGAFNAAANKPAYFDLVRIIEQHNDDVAAFQVLLDQGAYIHEKDKAGSTLLKHAAYHGQTKIGQLLIERGADVNAVNNAGEDILTWAAYWSKAELAQSLIDKGARIAPATKGKGAIYWARHHQQWEMMTALENALALQSKQKPPKAEPEKAGLKHNLPVRPPLRFGS